MTKTLRARSLPLGTAALLSAALTLHGAALAQAGASVVYDPTANASLFQQLIYDVKQTTILGDMLVTAQQSAAAIRYGTEVARGAYDVYNNLRYVSDNPADIYALAFNTFGGAFPELRSAYNDLDASRQNLQGLTDDRGYNPYAVQDLLFSARRGGQSAYSALFHLEEAWYGLTDEHLGAVKFVDRIRAEAANIRASLYTDFGSHNLGSLTRITAQASVENANANAATARAQAELVQQGRVEYVAKRAASARASGRVIDQAEGFDDAMDVVNFDFSVEAKVEFGPDSVEQYRPGGQ